MIIGNYYATDSKEKIICMQYMVKLANEGDKFEYTDQSDRPIGE